MKHISYLFLICFFLLNTGCEKYLDKAPDFGLDEDDVFSTYESARGYMDNCYASLLDIHTWNSQSLPRTSVNALSDEMGTLFTGQLNNVINAGNWLDRPGMGEIGWTGGATTGTFEGSAIENAFFCLRIANKMIEQAADIPNTSEQQKNELLGQAYFFRAWYYFQVIIRWGGMPLLDQSYGPDDDLDMPRLTYHESSAWLISDLDRAIGLLPHTWNESETGRVTKVAAMALKSMAALYDASPLMRNDLNSLQNNGYDVERCKTAARYANEVLQYVAAGTGGTSFRLMNGDEYKNIFYHEPNNASDESLWYNMDAGTRAQSRGLRVHYMPQHFSGGTGNDAAAFSNPTQNAVDMFEAVNNGIAYPISDTRSGYDPRHPFENRDPRLANNIIVPGEEWGVGGNNRPLYQELYVGGRDFNNAQNSNFTRNRTASGYMSKKFIWPEANTFTAQYERYKVNTIFIRLAQVYLDYAEAMNEAYGPSSDPEGFGLTAVQAVNVIRNRVGMPDVLPEFTASKEAFRERIRNERGVELMFENHRWHDLRRWMIAEEVFAQPIRGIRATPPAGHGSVADKSSLNFTYQVIDLPTEQRVFTTRHYWYPVALNHVQSLFNFQQNPGW